MSKLLNVLIVLVIILFIGYKFIYSNTISTGNEAPSIEETLINGDSFKLDDLKGKYVLIDFWGSWCPPCRRANKKLVPLHQKYHEKGFEILSIAIEKNEKHVHRAIEKDNLYWKYHIVQQSALVLSAPLALKYKITELPTTVLVNKEGLIMGSNLSIEKIDQLLAERL